MADPSGQIAAAMRQLTATREDLMVDECTVTRPATTGQTPELDDNGDVIATADELVWAGPCTVADPTAALRGTRTSLDESGVPHQRVLRVPHAANLLPGDLLTVTSSAFSPGMVGDTFLIAGEDERSYATYRRFVLRGSSWLSPEAGP